MRSLGKQPECSARLRWWAVLLCLVIVLPLSAFPPRASAFPQNRSPDVTTDFAVGPLYGVWALAIGDVGPDINLVAAARLPDDAELGQRNIVWLGDPSLDEGTSMFAFVDVKEVVVADVTGDGYNDILLRSSWQPSIQIVEQINAGTNGTIVAKNSYPELTAGVLASDGTSVTISPITSVAVGHFNGDNIPDVVVGDYEYLEFFDGPVAQGKSGPDRRWTKPDTGLEEWYPQIVVARLDSNTWDDLAVLDRAQNKVHLRYQSVPGGWAWSSSDILDPGLDFPAKSDPEFGRETTWGAPTWMAVGDFNADGRNDIVVTAFQGSYYRAAVFYQKSGGGFLTSPSLTLQGEAISGVIMPPVVLALDANNDGDKDIALLYRSGKVDIFLQADDHTLPASANYTLDTGQFGDTVRGAAGDLNGDKRDDLAVSVAGKVFLFYQESPDYELWPGKKIKTTPSPPYKGVFTQVTVTVGNTGKKDVTNVPVRLQIKRDSQVVKDTTQNISVSAGKQVDSVFYWTPDPEGSYTLIATVDTNDSVTEGNEKDNETTVSVKVLAPDLKPDNLSVQARQEGGAAVSARINNLDTSSFAGDAANIPVRFVHRDPGSNTDTLIGDVTLASLSAGGSQDTEVVWANPVADAEVKVMVDPDKKKAERDESNNSASLTLPGAPELERIAAKYYGTEIGGSRIYLLNDIFIPIKYQAVVKTNFNTIDRAEFTLSGPWSSSHTDSDGEPWQWPLDLKDKTAGQYTLTAQVFDAAGLVSNIVSYEIILFDLPPWALTMKLGDDGPLSVTVEDGQLALKISSSGWDALLKDDGGANDGADPLTEGNTGAEMEASVDLVLRSNGTGTVTGSVGGSSEMIGKTPKFTKTRNIEADIGVSATVEPDEPLKLTGGSIGVEVSVYLEHLYGIAIPVINKGVGIKISAEPRFEGNYYFESWDGSIRGTGWDVTVGARLEGGLAIDVWLGGAEVYGYADPSLTLEPQPPLSLEVGVGAGGRVWGGAWSWEGEIEGFHWTWPTSREVYYGTWVQGWMPETGSELGHGTNSVLSVDAAYDDMLYLAADYAGNTWAVWANNTTVPDQTEILYSIHDGSAWSAPGKVSNNANWDVQPVLAFDSTYNKGVAVWVHNKAQLTRATGYNTFQGALKDMEIYYAIWDPVTKQWGPETALTDDPPDAKHMDFSPAIAADGAGNVMVVWVRDLDGDTTTLDDRELRYVVGSWDGGAKQWLWNVPDSLLAPVMGEAPRPRLTFRAPDDALAAWAHDEDVTQSTLGDQPPFIDQLYVRPNPAAGQIAIYARIKDEGLVQAIAQVVGPSPAAVPLVLNPQTGLYQSVMPVANLVPGPYTVRVLAADTSIPPHHSEASVPFYSGTLPDYPPVVENPRTSKRVVPLNEPITLTVRVTDDIFPQALQVKASVRDPSGAGTLLNMVGPTGQGLYSVPYIPKAQGYYQVEFAALDFKGKLSIASTMFEVIPAVNTEIYVARYSQGNWSAGLLLTEKNDYQSSENPDIIADKDGNVIIVWEEHLPDGNVLLYNAFIKSIFIDIPKIDGPKIAENVRTNNRSPRLARTSDGQVLLVWQGDAPLARWPELYWAAMDSHRTFTAARTEFTAPVWVPDRLTFNDVTDWKPTVAIDPQTSIVTVAWLGHKTQVSGLRTRQFSLVPDDDDLYFERFDFPLAMARLSRVSRFDDGSLQKTLTFDRAGDEVVYIEVPEFSYPSLDARLQLTGMADALGRYPTELGIDIGNDGDYEWQWLGELRGVQTLYFNGPPTFFAELDSYIEAHNFKEGDDGEKDSKIKIPVRLHSGSAGQLLLQGIDIGFSFTPDQRPPRDNRPPTLTPISSVKVDEGNVVSIVAQGQDPDGDRLIYVIEDPRFSQQHNVFVWHTKDGDKGSYQVKVKVLDGLGGTAEQMVDIEVEDDNKAPVIEPIEDITIREGQAAVVIVFASDPNGDALGYSINLTQFIQNNNRFVWRTGIGDADTYNITVTASDGYFTTSEELTLQVVVGLRGDVNGDEKANIEDLTIVAGSFNTTPPSDPRADINGDGIVNIFDLGLVAIDFGKVVP